MEQFWKNPELEMLLTFPNEKMNLAQALIFNIQILQGPLVWNKLNRGLFPYKTRAFLRYNLIINELSRLIHVLKIKCLFIHLYSSNVQLCQCSVPV